MTIRLCIFRTNLPLGRAVECAANVTSPSKTKRMLPFAVGILLAWICSANAAYALNGFAYVTTCNPCQTTADFTNAATDAAQNLQSKGTYYVVSASQASSAYVHVDGHFQIRNGEEYWVLGSTTPIDASGNSLAGNSESANESYFASLDQVLWGASRNGPGLIEPGTLITVKFSDGTTAQYAKNPATSTYQWAWTGIAHNKDGKLIDRAGNLIANPNTAGAGGGTFSGPGFGPGSIDWFNLTGGNFCTYGGEIQFTDGTVLGGWEWGPC